MDISKLKAGDAHEFKILVETHKDRVFNTALNLLQNHELAEDTAQDVFIEVFQSVSNFNERSSISTWIYRITVNKALDHIRYQKRLKRFAFITSLFDKESGELIKDVSHFDHPGVQAERKEDARLLFAAIDGLPDNQRTAFVLSQMEDLPQKEIALIMDISVKAVESLIQRAKANLRKQLGKIYDTRRK